MTAFKAGYHHLFAADKSTKQPHWTKKQSSGNAFSKPIAFLVGCKLSAMTTRAANRFFLRGRSSEFVTNAQIFVPAYLSKSLITLLLISCQLFGEIINIIHSHITDTISNARDKTAIRVIAIPQNHLAVSGEVAKSLRPPNMSSRRLSPINVSK